MQRLLNKVANWDVRVGLEIHAQLTSLNTKLFSRAGYTFNALANSQIEPHDVAYPGSMPVQFLDYFPEADQSIREVNRKAVEWAIVAAKVLNCQINPVSQFDRKHYFYADSPAGFQITQNWHPIASQGELDYLWQRGDEVVKSSARLGRIQLENDTGKSLHDEAERQSFIDYNRSGVALIELVTEPDFHCGAQAKGFVQELQLLLRQVGVCRGRMSQGQMRVDCNVSVRACPTCQEDLNSVTTGIRTEIKNVGTLDSVQFAIG
ncbi:hypothetical protein Ciccas_001220 [Cichlidogyrus casuarinus]|uniref:Aspartyl/Glutamyl-tRNA(Gln) amidotransferase subunit B/E catalytic domain-containing protein n=1 Tax=Cichlidogyrus casuarinus TaxID=1844966 RepID=A0ABD2QLU7_9PLAT